MNKYLAGTASVPECNELFMMMESGEPQYNELLGQHITATLETGNIQGPSLTQDQKKDILGAVFAGEKEGTPVIELKDRKRGKMRWMVAAAILIAAVAGVYTWMQTSPKDHSVAQSDVQQHNVPAGIHAVTLTLADGSNISLDNTPDGVLTKQGNTEVTKKDGRLTYSHEQETEGQAVVYNTITVPAGSQYQVTLPDGSSVWLNTYSSLRFPVAFAGDERDVELTGEAYFEVAKDPSKKFIVSGGGIKTEVLGTHFNVSVYANEEQKRVTLAEGSVRVSGGPGSSLLKPGQQAQVLTPATGNQKGTIKVVDVDPDDVTAWKNGYFVSGSIDFIMNQLARWYNMEVVYEGTKPQRNFDGKIARGSLEDVLKILETNNIHVKKSKNGKQLVVNQ